MDCTAELDTQHLCPDMLTARGPRMQDLSFLEGVMKQLVANCVEGTGMKYLRLRFRDLGCATRFKNETNLGQGPREP